MDDLLAQLKSEFEPKPNAKQKANRSSSTPKSRSPQNSGSQPSMEQMLDELRKELESGRGRPNNKSQPQNDDIPKPNAVDASKQRDRLNALIDAEYQKQVRKREAKLAEIERQKQARIEEQKRRERELIEAQRREELRERRRKEAMQEKARQWLKNLNPRSEEGQWFEEFSYSYEDKLQAAIDYLEAMRETGL